ncbi:CLUMA_CG009071, isoform A [Clunio marinus]|uniref:CLUMA_CG009071, isoform A n=1 Tax=Clunio marinus TaxID=568069 RepID=A0A1J1I7R1_9DIPT|nr:CLUMA_CG009071, isoform A [Clunio marinus]
MREAKDIKFFLFTRDNPKTGKQIYMSDEKRLKSLNKTLPLILYIHGFSESAPGTPKSSSYEIRDALLDSGEYSVILVDWSPIAALPWYSNTVENTPRVGRYVARFLKFLIKYGIPSENIHVIGFSLGAEVAGFAGKTLKERGILLPRITGLDPAMPLFTGGDTNTHLSAGDAKFVDVIHTDGGFFGIPYPIGHVDFFPNNGVALQPGCVQEELSKNNLLGIVVGCSHVRAWQYFVESIRRPMAFLSDRCEQTNNESKECLQSIEAYMGFKADRRLRGKFYLTTNAVAPFGRNFPI